MGHARVVNTGRGGSRRERRRARRRARKLRRHPVRAAFIITILVASAATMWIYLLRREQLTSTPTSCPVSAAVPQQVLVSAAALEPVAPIPPGSVDVGVLNATDRRGLATQIATGLKVYGFTRARPAGNDLLHPAGTMRCLGQIRFGLNGAQAARTLALVLPCAQLVDDHRPDSTVDLVLGSAFSQLEPTIAARAALDQLEAAERHGGLQAITGPASSGDPPSLPYQQNC